MKKFITLLTAMLLSVVAMISFTKPVLADDDTPVVTLGTSLTDAQKQGTLKTLTAPLNGGNYQTITVTGSDLVKYLNPSGDNFTTSSGVWSSAMIQKTSSGSGINVKILDYDGKNNITTITANQYKNAALTAGISDANIYVTSAIPIDGSGALAGVYAAYAKNGNTLNQKQVNAAQDEMNTLSGITQDNKNKKGYSDAQLNNAVAGAKNEMAKQGQNITDSQIRDIVNNQININHLGDTINNNQKNQIVNLLIEIRDSGALKDGNFKQQASKLSSQIQNGAKNIFNKFNTQENRNWLQNLWDQIVKFFSGLFGGVILN
ncbi:DUF1002 domain-containing protein [Lactobacillus crispatus]|jgi:uncharacterized protein YpuA (DUF1002 family)|uniref:DUF1002 domain-containing protein n=1 Tax=Lactobacillus crispatus TaxID=47770 RepID=UPI0001B2A3E2|nr:DUF1002 domain-containing protein [Lactobacillus crispatus]EEU18542.1 hypothetical protein HMPREF5045_01558 [Lactobacillus crispatus 125-2-CHN]KWU11361.1 hypothetical protein AEL97_05040 [Lactobacillus crispatus]MBH9540700.1 DUF1002 domain-containing protein [Lactobacillus crispatus]MCT7795187.1 DUF1002 domain-containing protein [Lactobacillus crispatus]MCT7886947.1 DUF1002 domain-containing protein [Lactobacillus crispatus]